jgi:hypothetical protein
MRAIVAQADGFTPTTISLGNDCPHGADIGVPPTGQIGTKFGVANGKRFRLG